ncbi:hypothetical protein C8R44DRAFT_757868 [Mycena epipterygia]|nr:hypothetical protein C8R44DRAFT_757868 [Mycena epipterygia]
MLDRSPELVLEVLDLLSIPLSLHTDHPPNQATLAACSLVCKSWSAHSQRLLFRRVSIDTTWAGMIPFFASVVGQASGTIPLPVAGADQGGIIPAPGIYPPQMPSGPTIPISVSQLDPAVLDTIRSRPPPVDKITSFLGTITADTERSRTLRDHVRSIILRPHSSTKSSDIITILTNLPSLRELDLGGSRWYIFSDAELAELWESGHRIRSLRVNADHQGSITSMGPPAWPYILKLVAALPSLCMLDVTSNAVQYLPLFDPRLKLGLVSVKISSKWVLDAAPFVASLLGGQEDAEKTRLQLFHQTESMQPADLHAILLAHGDDLRSLAVQGLKDPCVLDLCTQLERFECEVFPVDALVAAIPRTIKALAVGAPVDPPLAPTLRLPVHPAPLSVDYFIQQLGTFPNLEVLTLVGLDTHPGFSMLRAHCNSSGIEFRSRPTTSLSDDPVEFSLRRRWLE